MKNDGGRTRCCSDGPTGRTAQEKSAKPAKKKVAKTVFKTAKEEAREKAAEALLQAAGEEFPAHPPDEDEPVDPVAREDCLSDRDRVLDPRSQDETAGLLSLDAECDCLDCTSLLRRKMIFAD